MMARRVVALFLIGVLSSVAFPSAAGPTDVVATIGSVLLPPVGSVFVPGDDDFADNDALKLTLQEGEDLTYVNLDAAAHTLTSVRIIPNTTTPLFDTGLKQAGQSGPVARADQLKPGEYEFYCVIHAGSMRGTLTVV